MTVRLTNTLTFSDEQSMLLDTSTSFFRERAPMAYVRQQLETEAGFERSLWDEMVGLGWSGLAIPEAFGGSGMGLAEAVVIAEPMGRHLLAAPFTSTQLVVQGLLAGGDEELQAELLPRIAEGAIGTVAVFEPDGSWDLGAPGCTAKETAGAIELSGTKALVTDAPAADVLLISARLGQAPVLAVVDRALVGQGALRRETVIDETRRSFHLDLGGIRVPAANVLRGAAAANALKAIQNAAWLLLSAEAAGGIAGVLDVIVEYLNTRTAFGRKIGSYQGLKHPSADILIGLERSRSHVYHAASVLAAGEEAEAALRMAKAQASDAFAFAGDRAIQFHGGFGFTYECDAQLFLRRALWLQYAYGDAAHHRKRLAELLLEAA